MQGFNVESNVHKRFNDKPPNYMTPCIEMGK